MARTIAASPVPVTLVPTGPLTNVARLLARTGGANVERIVLMGGAIAEGNMTPAAEFNIWADPEAAQAVFGAGLDTTMIGLDVTHRAVTTPRSQERLRATGTSGAFVADLVDFFTVLPPRDLRLGRRAHPRRGRRRGGDPAGARDDRRAQRRDRARLGALPRADGRRSLAANRAARRTPTSASTSTPPRSSSSSSSGSAGWVA